MNRIAIISLNNTIKEKFKSFLSPENYLVSFYSADDFTEGLADMVIFDLFSLRHLKLRNIKSEYLLKTIPVMAVINPEDVKKQSSICGADDFYIRNSLFGRIYIAY